MAFPTFVSVGQLDEANSDKMRGVRRYYTAVGAVEVGSLLGLLAKVGTEEGGSLLDLLAKVERGEGGKIVVEGGQSQAM